MISEGVDNMRKILSIVLIMTLVATIVPSTLANEVDTNNVEIDTKTQREVQIMGHTIGAQIRLLQLEKVITIKIIQGEHLISLLTTLKNDTTNISELEAILAELKLVKEEVQSADPNASDAVQTFIDLKNDSINLIIDFKTKLHTLVDNETAEKLKLQIKTITNETVEKLGGKIRNLVREYNANQLHVIWGFLKNANNSSIKRYKEGNCSIEKVKQNISEIAKNMTYQKRYEFILQIKEYNIHRVAQVQQHISTALKGFQERKQERLEERLNNIPTNIQGAVKEHLEQNLLNALDHLNNKQNGKTETPQKGGGGKK